MAELYGHWGECTLEGSRTITTNGIAWNVPDDANVKLVNAGKIDVAHIRHDGRVVVLSQQGQLIESDDEAKSRASESNWRAVAGT